MTILDLDKGGRIPQNVRTYLGPTKGWVMTDSPVNLEFPFSGGGGVIPTGVASPLVIPDWLYVYDWVVLSMSPSLASVQFDLWKTTLDIFLTGVQPTAANSITGTDKPRLVSQNANRSQLLTGWNRDIDQNDVLVPVLETATNAIVVTLILRCVRLKGPLS